MAVLGHFQLCAAEGVDRAEQMYMSPAYQTSAWAWLRRQVMDAKAKIEAAGGVLGCVVVKYFTGQGSNRDHRGNPVSAEPMALDLLEARDRNVAPGVIGPNPMQGRAGMEIFSRWCTGRGVKLFAYIGKAPDAATLDELETNDRDVEFVTGWFNAMAGLGWTFIGDNVNSPARYADWVRFVEFLVRHGCPRERFHAEAFCTTGGSPAPRGVWPNLAGCCCWGENEAWRVSGLPGAMPLADCGAGLLHTHGEATADVLAAARDGTYAVMNVNAMPMDALRAVVEAAAAGGAAGE